MRTRLTLRAFLKRRRWRRWGGGFVVVSLLGVLMAADRRGWLLDRGDDWTRYHGRQVRVVAAPDGDTLEIDVADGREPRTVVRLLGVDVPETSEPACAFTRAACAQSGGVRLLLMPQQTRDRRDRLLAYVELGDGRLLNEELLAQGWGRAAREFAHGSLTHFIFLERAARMRQRGQWARGRESGAGAEARDGATLISDPGDGK